MSLQVCGVIETLALLVRMQTATTIQQICLAAIAEAEHTHTHTFYIISEKLRFGVMNG